MEMIGLDIEPRVESSTLDVVTELTDSIPTTAVTEIKHTESTNNVQQVKTS